VTTTVGPHPGAAPRSTAIDPNKPLQLVGKASPKSWRDVKFNGQVI
jgi:hypothetical protein